MKAVAMMTPEPKYFAMKKSDLGMPSWGFRLANTGNTAPVACQSTVKYTRARLHTEYRTDQNDEDGGYPDAHAPVVPVGTNAVAWRGFIIGSLTKHEVCDLDGYRRHVGDAVERR